MSRDEDEVRELAKMLIRKLRETRSAEAKEVAKEEPESRIEFLMRAHKMSRAAAERDYEKRTCEADISFHPGKQSWLLKITKGDLLLLEKSFTKSSKANILHWFHRNPPSESWGNEPRMDWKKIETGTPWKGTVYVERIHWPKLNISPQLFLCQIIEFDAERARGSFKIGFQYDDTMVISLGRRQK